MTYISYSDAKAEVAEYLEHHRKFVKKTVDEAVERARKVALKWEKFKYKEPKK